MPQTQHAQWQLQTAKAQLSEVVDAALRGEPQRITRRGKDAVVVLSELEYVALKSSAKRDALNFVEYLLSIPKERAANGESGKANETRTKIKLREVVL